MGARLSAILKALDGSARAYGLPAILAISVPVIIYVSVGLAPIRGTSVYPWPQPGEAAIRAEDGPSAAPAVRREMPAIVKGLYVTSLTAGDAARFAHILGIVDRTEINTLVIDVKNGNGELAFSPVREELKPHAEKRPSLGTLRDFTGPLREKGIYLIARTFVFQDPALVKLRPDLAVRSTAGGIWRDRRGTPWVDPASEEGWAYNVAVAREAFEGGFDEIQFDYIRFPSDGNMKTLAYPVYDKARPKEEVMGEFFAYLDRELRGRRIPISADLFGLVMWNHDDDLGIGQRLSVAARHFDAISPMVYPSHYADGFNGYANPAEHPSEVVRENMRKGMGLIDALRRENARERAERPTMRIPPIATIRPWLQDFNLGATYTAAMVRGQIRESEENRASGWLLWNAKNAYTESALVADN